MKTTRLQKFMAYSLIRENFIDRKNMHDLEVLRILSFCYTSSKKKYAILFTKSSSTVKRKIGK